MINSLARQSDRLIVVSFPSFAGGKFLMNCLSLSRHCVPQSTQCAWHLIDHPADYDYRLQAVCSTLPPVSDMHEWRAKWEFGDTEFYQGSVSKHLTAWHHNQPTPVDGLLKKLIDADLCFFMTSHGGWSGTKPMLEVWPNARIVLLTNCFQFWSLAIRLKQPQPNGQRYQFGDYAGNECQEKYNILRGSDWPDWNLFESHNYDIDNVAKHVTINHRVRQEIKSYYGWHENANNLFNFDVDNNYFDKPNFLKTMERLYDWMGFDDYNPTLIDQFYSRYISLHKETPHGQTI